MGSWRQGLLLLGVFVAYVVTAKVGLTFDAVSGLATAVWPPTGISLAALLLFGPRLWPAIAAGAFVANLQAGAPLAAAVGIAVGNTLEAVAGAWLLRRAQLSPALDRVRDAVALVALGALLSTTVSATLGTASVWAAGHDPEGSVVNIWWTWWVGDAGGDLVVAPFLLCWLTSRRSDLTRRRLLEAVALAVTLVGLGVIAFGRWERAYIAFPPLLWAALRFGPRGASLATLVLTVIAVLFTAVGQGPFALGPERASLVELQLFVAVLATTALLLGAASAERSRAVVLRDEFLSIASHELRTPLTALKLRLEGTARRLQRGQVDDTTLERVNATAEQIERLERLINELLDVSRITAGRLHLELAEVKLAVLVKSAASRLPTTVAVELDVDESVTGRWDPLRMEQVVTNLLQNAREHGAPPIRVSVERRGPLARLVVRDAGPGIAPEDRRRVFERFEQSGKSGGLGLGLYIIRQIVEAHGGSIRADQGPEGGARFVVEIPTRGPGGA